VPDHALDGDLIGLVRLGGPTTTEPCDTARAILGAYLATENDPHAREMFELAMSLGSNPGEA